MNPDFVEFLAALISKEARFLVVGAHALAAHGVPRATGDIDIWFDRSPENADRVFQAMVDFGAPTASMSTTAADLRAPEMVFQIGLPPRRIDLLSDVSGLSFDEAWSRRITHRLEGLELPFLGRADLVQNKRASGRHKDLGDLEALGEEA